MAGIQASIFKNKDMLKEVIEIYLNIKVDIRGKGNITKGEFILVTSLFDILKGKEEMQLVYDATKSGINEVWFSLQKCESQLCSVNPGISTGDTDLGEIFIIFPQIKCIQKYAGVDLTEIFSNKFENKKDF